MNKPYDVFPNKAELWEVAKINYSMKWKYPKFNSMITCLASAKKAIEEANSKLTLSELKPKAEEVLPPPVHSSRRVPRSQGQEAQS